MKISVVLPVYNEKENLRPLQKEITEAMEENYKDWEVIYVDDGSSDGSPSVLEEIAEKNQEVKVIKFRKNFGQSSALQAGFDHVEGEVVVAMDSDGQNDPKDIPRLIDKLEEGYDCVSGWRKDRKDSIGKRVSSKLASLLRKPFLGKTVHDYGCTLKAYRKEALEDLQLYGEMHRYIPPLLRWKGYRVTEIVVNHRERKAGKTKYGTKRLFKGFLDMINVWFWQKFSQRPLHIFGGLGLLSIFFGFLFAVFALYQKFMLGVSLSDTAATVLSAFLVLIGAQFFISGLLADISLKNYHQSADKDVYNIEKVLE